MKVCDGEERKWPTATHAIFWAEQIMTHKALEHSTYYFTHGVEPLLPFDLAEATYMVPVRGHPSVSLLPLSSPTLPLSICTPYHHLCIISKDRTYSRRLSGPMVRRLPKSRFTDSRRLPASPPARTSTASDGLRTHRDRSA
jgi:hypothetical protein